MYYGKLSFVILTLFLIISGCSNKEDEQSVNSVKSKPPEDKAVIADVEENSYYSPLTGLETEHESLKQRPVAVMINNHPSARPQSGLHKADIVYEILSEGKITRFLAIFQSELPDIIGPVRSAREYYIDLSNGFDSIYISHGWSPSAKLKLESGEADYINGLFYDGNLFWRDDHRKAPHNSYISGENILKGAKENQYKITSEVKPYTFYTDQETSELTGDEVKNFVVKYDKSPTWQAVYEYQQTNNIYIRSSGDEQTVDLESGTPVQISNVFVVEMKHEIVDKDGRREIDITSGGKAFLFQNGLKLQTEWENREGRILPVIDGDVVKFVPGSTWINIVPNIDEAILLQS